MNASKAGPVKHTALVTGASSGLGEAMAKNLARRGHDLILVSENREELDRVKRELEDSSSSAVTVIATDLFNPESADLIHEFCMSRAIGVDMLLNCAGIFVNIDREMHDIGAVENVVNLHVMSLTKLCFLFGADMVKRGSGYILNVSSIAARFPDPASLTYGPTKRYILSLSEALHCEWKPHNVKVTCLTPGGIKTNFFNANSVFIPPIIKSTLITAERCAEIGLDALFSGRGVITPGLFGKFQSLMLRIISRPRTYSMIKNQYFSMKKKNST